MVTERRQITARAKMVGGTIVREGLGTGRSSVDLYDLREPLSRPRDNLRMEGSFQGGRDNVDWVPASKPVPYRPVDNLVPPGPVEGRTRSGVYAAGERASIVRHSDNLALTGEVDYTTTTSSASKKRAMRRKTWTKQDGERYLAMQKDKVCV